VSRPSSARLLRSVTRLDFLDGLGIAIGRRSVGFAHLVKRLATVTLQHHRVVPLPPPEQAADRRIALTAAVRLFLDESGVKTDRVFVSVPRSLALVSRLFLPSAAKSDLNQVVEFELDRLIPLDRGEVYFDFLSREAGEKVEVLVMSMPRRPAAEILDALEEGGARVRSLVVTPLAMLDWMHFARVSFDGPLALLVDDGGSVELDLVSGGELVASHVVKAAEVETEAAVASLVGREVSALGGGAGEARSYSVALASASAEFGAPSAHTLPENVLATGRDLLALGKGVLAAPDGFFEAAPAGLLPAIGAGLEAVREGETSFNLLPPEERRAVEEGAPVITFFLAAVLVLVSLVWVVSAMVKDQVMLASLRNQFEELEPRIRAVHAHDDEADRLREKLTVLTSDDHVRNSLFLQELTRVIPKGAYLTAFRVRSGRVEVEGFAASASELVPLLEKSPLFQNAQFTSPVTKVQNNEERFSLTTEIAK